MLINKTVFISSIFLLTIQLANTSEPNQLFDSNSEMPDAEKVFVNIILYIDYNFFLGN